MVKKIPGIFLLVGVGLLSKFIAGYIPHLDYVLVAIALGMLIRNTVTLPQILEAGVDTYELWLKIGIVFLGARLVLGDVLSLGAKGLLMVLVEIIVSLTVIMFLARKFGLSDKLGSLLAVGVGICGVSAIIGASGAIDAEEEDAALAIATILIFGAVMIFLFPLLGQVIGLSPEAFGYWAGLAIDNTSEAVATGFAFSEVAGQYATLTKLGRNALMGVVILFFAIRFAGNNSSKKIDNKLKFIWSKFPKFLLGFLLMSLLSTVGFFNDSQISVMKHLTNWAFMLAFVGVGFRTRISEMKKAGFKAAVVGFGGELAVAIVTLLMVQLVV
jgi:uncharacterized integral membrane protein (TIGR00698 family)